MAEGPNQSLQVNLTDQQVNPDPIQPEERSFFPKPFLNQKGNFIMILGIILVVVIIGVGIYLTINKTTDIGKVAYQKNFTDSSSAPIVLNRTSKLAVIPDKFTEIENVTFSQDGKHVAYKATVGQKFTVVLDEKEGKQYDRIDYITFSPNGEKIAYVATLDKKDFVVVNNEEGTRYDEIRNVVFSPDSKLVAYAILYWPGGFSGLVISGLVIGDQEFKNLGNALLGSFEDFTFSQNGKKAAWVTGAESSENIDTGNYRKKDEVYLDYYVITIDLESKKTSKLSNDTYDNISQLVSSPDGQKIAYTGSKNDKKYISINGSKYELPDNGVSFIIPSNYSNIVLPNFSEVSLAFSPDSQKLAYVTYDTGKNYLILGDQRFDTLDFYGLETPIVFSPNGKRTAFGVRDKLAIGNYMIVDNHKEKVYEGISYPVFSPDSQKVAYVVEENNKKFIVINGKEIEISEIIYTSPIFTADSKMIGYGAKSGNELWWILKSAE